HHNRWGWCWAPDTVWGPAWVSWRYNNSYCGWAPLPPTACYRPGFGFSYFGHSVGFGFGFGLTARHYTFVPLDHFHERSPGRFRVPHREIDRVWGATTVHNQMIRGNNNLLINRGVPVDRVAAATHTQIHPMHVRVNSESPRSIELGRDGRSLNIFRPNLPAPTHRTNPRFVGEGVQRAPHFDLRTRTQRPTTQPTASRPISNPSTPGRTPIISGPTGTRPGENPARDNRFQQPNQERPGSLIMRGPNRGNPSGQQNPTRNDQPTLRHGPVFNPHSPARPYAPADNNPRSITPPQQPTAPAQPPRTVAPPTSNRPGLDQRGNGANLQQRQLQQQPTWPRQEAPSLGTPRMNDQNINPGFRSDSIRREPIPSEQPRRFEQPRSFEQPRQNYEQPRSFEQPRQNFDQPRIIEPRSAPAREFRQDNGGGYRGGNPGGGGGGGHANFSGNSGGGGGGGGGHSGGGGGGGWGGNNGGNGNGGGRNR
ncbi:MAG TPA: DUF6600 domain-containing protein, partial [Verrucomicrobiae bacterium]|nr:DUF6600 domain-containing protein [Verrucomicrobiae bacterium]